MNFIRTALCLFLSLGTLMTQAQSFTTFQLPTPQNVSSLFAGPIFGSKIFYGATPNNLDPKKPVIVYVHGFTDLGGVWFRGNNIYDETYRNGQNCAFVAMTRGQGMWTNGQLLAVMLDDITQRFGVNQVVIVAHSNGGKASEVALFWQNRSNKVERVITLGTPFWGTELANIAEMPGFGWVVDLVGFGGGTSTSTTYYMGGVARPFLDNLPNNQPGKFINFGAWGYNNGNGASNIATTTGGNLLNWLGSGPSRGGNDGVTPYWSSTRPGGRPQWVPGHGNPVSRYNHQGMAGSNVIWPWLLPRFTAPLGSLRLNGNEMPDPVALNSHIESRNQFLNSAERQTTFVMEPNVRQVEMTVLHRTVQDVFELERQTPAGDWMPLYMDLNHSKPKALYTGYSTHVILTGLAPGRYRLKSAATFAAVIHQQKGVVLTYNNQHQFSFHQQPSFSAKLERAEQYDLTQVQFRAVMTLKHDLEGEPVEEQVFIESVQVDAEGVVEFTPSQHLPVGVYNMVLHAEHPEFQKSLVTGFAVHKNKTRVERQNNAIPLEVAVFPNPAQDYLQVQLDNKIAVTVTLYNLKGSVLYQKNIPSVGKQQLSIDLAALNLAQGTYFVEVQEGTQKTATAFVVAL